MGAWRYSSTILDLGTRWKWSASRPGRFTPEEEPPVPIGEEAGGSIFFRNVGKHLPVCKTYFQNRAISIIPAVKASNLKTYIYIYKIKGGGGRSYMQSGKMYTHQGLSSGLLPPDFSAKILEELNYI
jgi:hypothetical protein